MASRTRGRLWPLLVAAALVLAPAAGDITEGIGAADTAAIVSAAHGVLGAGPRGGLDGLHALLALRALGVPPSDEARLAACRAAAADLADAAAAATAAGRVMAAKDALGAIGVVRLAGCETPREEALGAVAAAVAAGARGRNLWTVYYGVAAGEALAAVAPGRRDPPLDWGTIVDEVLELLVVDVGTFHESPGGRASARGAAFALRILAVAARAQSAAAGGGSGGAAAVDLSERLRGGAASVGALVRTVSSTPGPDGSIAFGEGAERLATTGMVTMGAIELAAALGTGVELSPAALAGLTMTLLGARGWARSGGAEAAYCIAGALRGISGLSTSPLAVALLSPSVSPASPLLRVRVESLLGARVPGVAVRAVGATLRSGVGGRGGGVGSAVPPAPMIELGGGVFELELAAPGSLAAGTYDLELQLAGGGYAGRVLRRAFRVSTTLGVPSARIVVAAYARLGRGEVAHTDGVPPGRAPVVLLAGPRQFVHVLFDVVDGGGRAMPAHQAFVRLRHVPSGAVTTFVATFGNREDPARGYSHAVTLDASDRGSLRGAAGGGTFDVELLVGDASAAGAVEWTIGSVTINPAAPPARTPEPVYTRPLLADSDAALGPLPELLAAPPTPPPAPPAALAHVFTAAAVAPALLLAYGVRAGYADLGAVPTGAAFAWSTAFFALLACMLVVIVELWLRLTMLAALRYLAVLGAAAGVAGQRMLAARRDSRRAAAGGAAPAAGGRGKAKAE